MIYFRKTVRQKTESSLPEDSMDNMTLDVKTGKLRRTSSMPSVCDDVVAQSKLEFFSMGNCLLLRNV